ncbi:MAG: hypothetical protein KIT58_22040, partial [Planctomycetota bacterium]|nr:hypothetical protein [Planctomycetota bacterium]
VYRTTDAGRTWAQVATTRGVVPLALAGSLAALPDGRVGVLAHGGDIVARRLGAWYGELDPGSGAWTAAPEPVLDPHADDYGWLDGALAMSPTGPIVAGMSTHRRALFCRRGVNGWTPLQAISDERAGFACPAADDAGRSIHFAFSTPRTPTHPGALLYRRWEHFEWAAEGVVELEASVPTEFCLDIDREGTAHALWVVDGVARYARRRGSGAFDRREVATLSTGAEVALQVEPRPAVFLLERSRLQRIDLEGPGGSPELIADLSSLGTVSHLSVPRRSDERDAVVALVTVRRGKLDDRVVAIGARER